MIWLVWSTWWPTKQTTIGCKYSAWSIFWVWSKLSDVHRLTQTKCCCIGWSKLMFESSDILNCSSSISCTLYIPIDSRASIPCKDSQHTGATTVSTNNDAHHRVPVNHWNIFDIFKLKGCSLINTSHRNFVSCTLPTRYHDQLTMVDPLSELSQFQAHLLRFDCSSICWPGRQTWLS